MPSMLNCSITEYTRLDCVLFFAHECMRQIKESGSFLKAHTHMNIHKQMPVALRMLGGVMCIGVWKRHGIMKTQFH